MGSYEYDVYCGALAFVAFALVLAKLTRRLRSRVPRRIATLGKTASAIARDHPARVKGPGEGWTREEIKEIVDQLIVEVLEVEQFSENSEFVRDMRGGGRESAAAIRA